MADIDDTRELEVAASGGRPYSIVFGGREGIAAQMLSRGLSCKRCLVVTDDNVAELYGAEMERALEDAGVLVETHVIRPGEGAKDLEVLSTLYRWGFANHIDRSTPVIAFGGGVVGDLAGFFAATALRGVPLVHVPTTLVAQVDSSIGGKTGINHASGKNLVGAFYRPFFTLTDVTLLQSLPIREWRNGLSEVLKHALIRDEDFYTWLREHWPPILERDELLVPELVARAINIKVDVVVRDELESGLRRILNFGHTFGHAMERIAGYGTLGHGAAVALGMRAAAWLSAERGNAIPLAEIDALLQDLTPERVPRMPVDWLMQSMRRDKKRVGEVLHLVLLRRVGEAQVVDDATDEELRSALEFALS